MKKMILMILCLFSFNYSFGAVARTSRIYLAQEPIRGTPSVDFAMVGVEIDNKIFQIEDENSYFKFVTGSAKNRAITIENIKIDSSENKVEGDRIYFKYRPSTGYYIKVNISGKFIFKWSEIPKWPPTDNIFSPEYQNRTIKIGEIHQANGIFIKDREVFLILPGMKISDPLNVEVKQHMNLGRGMAGEIFKTNGGTTGGTPAEISLNGGANEKVRVIIPKNTTITNGINTLNVDLKFRDINAIDDTDRFILKKVFSNSGIVDNIIIDGTMITEKGNTKGRYKGNFKVRAEYID